MKKLFRYLRKQPKHIRDRYALLFSLGFTLIVVGFWLAPQLQNEVNEAEVVSEDTSNPPFATLFSNMKKQAAAVFSSLSFEAKETEVDEITNATNTATSKKIQNANELQLTADEVKALKEKLDANATSAIRANQPAVLIATTSAATSTKTESN